MLTWATPFNICCFLDSQGYSPPASKPAFQALLAVGAADCLKASAGTAFPQLKAWAAGHQDWIFGHLSYDLAGETERSSSAPQPAPHPDDIGFPDLCFFLPEILIELQVSGIRIGTLTEDPETVWKQIRATPVLPPPSGGSPIHFTPRFTREEYLDTINALRRHILRGDCYEINFCQEFFARHAAIDPVLTWQALSQASPNPFSAFYRLDQSYLFCASPERYMQKRGNTLCSQPIKGTAPRYPDDALADEASGRELFHSTKDRSENVMVVDLVRNDLARVCQPGSVRVTELFGVYAFPQVFQMISTVTGELAAGHDGVDALQATFPMGSMTGAPKNRVVHLIGQYERSRRGLFSGALGYLTPEKDFDFNVVIRSLLYNRDDGYLSYQVGSGITFYSDPLKEYEECLVKAAGIRKALALVAGKSFS